MLPSVCVRIPTPWSFLSVILFLRNDRARISIPKPYTVKYPIPSPASPPTSHITTTPRSAQVTTSSVSCNCPLIVEAEDQIALEISDNSYSGYMRGRGGYVGKGLQCRDTG
jgi:hypothetical protein